MHASLTFASICLEKNNVTQHFSTSIGSIISMINRRLVQKYRYFFVYEVEMWIILSKKNPSVFDRVRFVNENFSREIFSRGGFTNGKYHRERIPRYEKITQTRFTTQDFVLIIPLNSIRGTIHFRSGIDIQWY